MLGDALSQRWNKAVLAASLLFSDDAWYTISLVERLKLAIINNNNLTIINNSDCNSKRGQRRHSADTNDFFSAARRFRNSRTHGASAGWCTAQIEPWSARFTRLRYTTPAVVFGRGTLHTSKYKYIRGYGNSHIYPPAWLFTARCSGCSRALTAGAWRRDNANNRSNSVVPYQNRARPFTSIHQKNLALTFKGRTSNRRDSRDCPPTSVSPSVGGGGGGGGGELHVV